MLGLKLQYGINMTVQTLKLMVSQQITEITSFAMVLVLQSNPF
jgi:hypothetical protein